MLFNLNFATTATLSYLLFYPAIIAHIFNPIEELLFPIEIPIKEVKAEIEIHPVIEEAKIRKCSI